jgi:hypothetical protein
MEHIGIEGVVILTGVVLWFAHGWYLNERLKLVHQKLELVLNDLNGLRIYLYEIDPQFDDERKSADDFANRETTGDMFAGMNDVQLQVEKEKTGKRTLDTRF